MAESREPPPQDQGTQAEQHPGDLAKSQSNGEQQVAPAQQMPNLRDENSARNADRQGERDAEKRAEEASEYGTFFGRRLKITDALLAIFTFFLVLVGIGQGIFLFRTDQGTHKAADAAKDSAEAALRQVKLMEADQRPWISLEMKFRESLTSDSDGSHVLVNYTLNNVGKSPAFNLDFMAAMIPMGDIQPTPPGPPGYSFSLPPSIVDEAVEKLCEQQQFFGTRKWGQIMFPNNPREGKWRVHGSNSAPGFIPGFIVIGCASYKIANDPTVHHTIRIYELRMGPYGQMIDLSRSAIPNAELAFFPHPENGSRAN